MEKTVYQEICNVIDNSIDETVKKAFGRSLKALREHTNTTQRELAEIAKVPHQSVSVYERGTTIPTVLQAFRIALYFGLTIDDFIIYGMGYNELLGELDFKTITDKYDAINKE